MRRIFKILPACFCLFATIMVMKSCNETMRENRKIIGKKIVVGRDTLIIIGYSYWDNKYSLNNGVELGEKWVLNNFLKN